EALAWLIGGGNVAGAIDDRHFLIENDDCERAGAVRQNAVAGGDADDVCPLIKCVRRGDSGRAELVGDNRRRVPTGGRRGEGNYALTSAGGSIGGKAWRATGDDGGNTQRSDCRIVDQGGGWVVGTEVHAGCSCGDLVADRKGICRKAVDCRVKS